MPAPAQQNYAESMLKGRMAETLVEELLKRSGNTVYRFGYEAVLQNLVQLETNFDRNAEVSERLRAIPDFIVLDPKGVPSFVEVKFRWNPSLPPYDEKAVQRFEQVERYWDPLMIFVNCIEKPYFRVSYPPYFRNASQPERGFKMEPLTSVAAWNIAEDAYEECEILVEKYLTPTLKKEDD